MPVRVSLSVPDARSQILMVRSAEPAPHVAAAAVHARRTCDEPLVGGLGRDAADPARVAADHAHQRPVRVPLRLGHCGRPLRQNRRRRHRLRALQAGQPQCARQARTEIMDSAVWATCVPPLRGVNGSESAAKCTHDVESAVPATPPAVMACSGLKVGALDGTATHHMAAAMRRAAHQRRPWAADRTRAAACP